MKEKNIIAAAAETPSFDFLGLGTNSTAELNTHSVMNHHTDSGWDLDYDFSLNLKQVWLFENKNLEEKLKQDMWV